MEHYISQTREELQEQLDSTCRLVERLTEAVKTLAHERDAEAEKYKKTCDQVDGIAKLLVKAERERDEYREAWNHARTDSKLFADQRDAAKEKLMVINLIVMASNCDTYKVAAIRKVLVEK